ncbi:PIN domain-containing protein [Streptomyces sp. P9(2023)]|uniref:PIN domain-containing protein n=1 Tax=Streptomyces sp. P9(2023) TaxID=3064394 RepID=UPI0028F3FC93|nr:PIN domain-containing protein [Streptomyces sp. P9(2023)]MDT9689567.1 PIN domain-containing protein [Streptomyces sp. P9(2023)]
MAFTVVYDACVLYPSTLRDLLIRIAQAGLVRAKWTDRILDEVFRNLQANRPELDPTKLARTRELMMRAVRDCLVKDYEPLEAVLELPDADDRHVLAAAVKSRAQLIVTNNLKDFPQETLTAWNAKQLAQTTSSWPRSTWIVSESSQPSSRSPTPGESRLALRVTSLIGLSETDS